MFICLPLSLCACLFVCLLLSVSVCVCVRMRQLLWFMYKYNNEYIDCVYIYIVTEMNLQPSNKISNTRSRCPNGFGRESLKSFRWFCWLLCFWSFAIAAIFSVFALMPRRSDICHRVTIQTYQTYEPLFWKPKNYNYEQKATEWSIWRQRHIAKR